MLYYICLCTILLLFCLRGKPSRACVSKRVDASPQEFFGCGEPPKSSDEEEQRMGPPEEICPGVKPRNFLTYRGLLSDDEDDESFISGGDSFGAQAIASAPKFPPHSPPVIIKSKSNGGDPRQSMSRPLRGNIWLPTNMTWWRPLDIIFTPKGDVDPPPYRYLPTYYSASFWNYPSP